MLFCNILKLIRSPIGEDIKIANGFCDLIDDPQQLKEVCELIIQEIGIGKPERKNALKEMLKKIQERIIWL